MLEERAVQRDARRAVRELSEDARVESGVQRLPARVAHEQPARVEHAEPPVRRARPPLAPGDGEVRGLLLDAQHLERVQQRRGAHRRAEGEEEARHLLRDRSVSRTRCPRRSDRRTAWACRRRHCLVRRGAPRACGPRARACSAAPPRRALRLGGHRARANYTERPREHFFIIENINRAKIIIVLIIIKVVFELELLLAPLQSDFN